MHLTVDEQRSVERGDVVRCVPDWGSAECALMRADVFDRLQSELASARRPAALSAVPASVSRAGAQAIEAGFQPASRRWNLAGMVIGMGLGFLPAALPAPIGPEMTWVIVGAAFGFFAPFAIFVHGHFVKIDQKLFWTVCQIGAGIGIAIGVALAFSGAALPKEALSVTGTGGFFAGFAATETYLRLVDARRREAAQRRNGIGSA